LAYLPIAQGEQGAEPEVENWPAEQKVPTAGAGDGAGAGPEALQLDDPEAEVKPTAQDMQPIVFPG